MKKFVIITCLLLLLGLLTIYLIPEKTTEVKPLNIVGELTVKDIYLYGNHLNLEIDIADEIEPELIIYGKSTWTYDLLKNDDGYYSTSEYLNKGINLDALRIGHFQIFIKSSVKDELGEDKYYKLKIEPNKKDLEYYAYSNNGQTKKVKILVNDDFEVDVYDVKMPSDLYDIVIDPGHGGSEPGAVVGEDLEKDFNLEYSLLLKEKLEEQGFKVKLTRKTDVDTDAYGENGRVSIPFKTKAKLNLSLHFNASTVANYYNGVEIYSTDLVDNTFAKKMALNIKNEVGLEFSNLNTFNKGEGLMIRNYDEAAINKAKSDAKDLNIDLYETLDETTPYYFVLRESGGVLTKAYVDGRDERYPENIYRFEYYVPESYLLELGYMDHEGDLEKIMTKKNEYINAITKTITEQIKTN